MKISELIKELRQVQKEKGDVKVVAVFDTESTCKFVPLEKDGIVFDRFNKGRKLLYIGW